MVPPNVQRLRLQSLQEFRQDGGSTEILSPSFLLQHTFVCAHVCTLSTYIMCIWGVNIILHVLSCWPMGLFVCLLARSPGIWWPRGACWHPHTATLGHTVLAPRYRCALQGVPLWSPQPHSALPGLSSLGTKALPLSLRARVPPAPLYHGDPLY